MKYYIPKIPPDSFDWSRWRQGLKIWREIGVACREVEIIRNSNVLRKYAIGYCEGGRLFCRPKNNEVAVMCIIDNEFCWTHFRKKEFENVFGI
ncbi:MAG: hypothetical protein WA061_01860 [Microgenomates group bacterium]